MYLPSASFPATDTLSDTGPPLHETAPPLCQTCPGMLHMEHATPHPTPHCHTPTPHCHTVSLSSYLSSQAGSPSLASLDSGHATMTSTAPTTPHSQSTSRGPVRATMRPRGLPSSPVRSSPHPPPPTSTLSSHTSHPPSSHSHRRSRSADSIRRNCFHRPDSKATPTNHHSHHAPSTSHHLSQQYSATETSTNTRGYNSTTHATSPLTATRANQCTNSTQGKPTSRGSNKENTPSRSVDGKRGGGQMGSENSGPPSRGSGVPFRDRTNTSSHGVSQLGQQEQKKIVGKGNSLSELAPPLNAARLRPIQQSTRTATVSHPHGVVCWTMLSHISCSHSLSLSPMQVCITAQGRVTLHFTGKKPHESSGSAGSGEIIQISQNGMDVSLAVH